MVRSGAAGAVVAPAHAASRDPGDLPHHHAQPRADDGPVLGAILPWRVPARVEPFSDGETADGAYGRIFPHPAHDR